MRETILRQKRVISRHGFVPMHDLHMATAAGAGLDVLGLDPASLKLTARLCRLLAERFLEVMRIPDGEDRVVELSICSRQSNSAGTQASILSSVATPAPIPLRHRSSRPVEALCRVRKDKLTPSQRLRALANPESAMAAGPRKRKVVAPLQPYGQSLPGEEGYEEIPRRREMAVVATSTPEKAPSAESSGNADQDVSFDHDFGDVLNWSRVQLHQYPQPYQPSHPRCQLGWSLL
ncbi:LOW QUALITY PROTEIN: Hypothetical protein PHPALM_12565 [Phytophthora palmivora]|uniref:Uncharacterized protein n=1 Tax=Phytophthora palmivora TaxID=4796 RepID=A0A2P4XZF0_9STRA|nr:LOW QUALITY PROTEIN: Hypothetical protein PHPALM_12565 [Phytophthora palmivora]